MISKKNLITLITWSGSLLCVLLLSACPDDEAEVRELRQLREKLASAEKKAAEATKEAEATQSELAKAASAASAAPAAPVDNGMAQRLEESQKRIADLEAQLAAAHQKSVEDAAKPADAAGSLRNQARQVQENLMKQMGALSDSLQARHTGPSLEEITVKKVQSGFRSEIVFSVLGGDGQMRKLSFPVEADLEGHWNLPSLEIIATHLGTPPSQSPPPQPEQVQTTAPSTAAPAPAPSITAPTAPAPAPVANVPASPRPATDTVVIQWDKTPGRPPVVAAPPAPPPPAPPTPTPAKPAAAAAAAAAATAAPKAPPAPIMPVTKSVQIRFD